MSTGAWYNRDMGFRNDLQGPSRTYIVDPIDVPKPQEVPVKPERKEEPVKEPVKEPVPA